MLRSSYMSRCIRHVNGCNRLYECCTSLRVSHKCTLDMIRKISYTRMRLWAKSTNENITSSFTPSTTTDVSPTTPKIHQQPSIEQPQNDEKTKKKKFIPISVWLAMISPLVFYIMWRKDARRKSLAICEDRIVSLSKRDVVRLCKSAKLTSQDVMKVLTDAIERYEDRYHRLRSGLFVGALNMSGERRGQEQQQQKQELSVEKMYVSPDEISRAVHSACANDTDLQPFSVMLMFRTIPEYTEMPPVRLPLSDMLVGVSQLAQDVETVKPSSTPPRYEWDVFSPFSSDEFEFMCEHYLVLCANSDDHNALKRLKMKAREKERQYRWGDRIDMSKKIDMAFCVKDHDSDGYLGDDELHSLVASMLRTGHFKADSITHQTKVLPPRFSHASAEDITCLYRNDWHTSNGLTSDQPVRMSLQQFKDISKSLTIARVVKLWYLEPPRWIGFFSRWQSTLYEVYQRYMDGRQLRLPVTSNNSSSKSP